MGLAHPESSIPEWKLRLVQLKNKDINTTTEYRSQFAYGDDEVGMKNPNTESHVKIFDNGNVEMFAGDNTGIVISDQYDTLNLYGNAVNVNTYNMNIATRPYGLTWNGFVINPQIYQLYDEDFQLDGTVKYWVEETDTVDAHWARRRVSIKPFTKSSESEEFKSLLSELGIPI